MTGKTEMKNIASVMGIAIVGVLLVAYFFPWYRNMLITGKGGGA